MTTAPNIAGPASARSRFGPYRIDSELDAGGMGIVYRAQHVSNGTWVALKTVQVEGESLVAGVRREIKALRALDHPGVVRIVDDGTERGVPWYAMELLQGPNLRELHRDRIETPPTRGGSGDGWDAAPTRALRPAPLQAPPPAEDAPVSSVSVRSDRRRMHKALSIMRTLCRTLAFVHGKGLVHRDLKPDNIVLLADRGPVLVDFGIAVRALGASSRETLDAAGRPVGSPGYMAPEQIRGDIVDGRADLYAIGCMLFEIATGRLPFDGHGMSAVLAKKVHSEAPSPRAFVPTLDEALDRLITRLLARRPEDRPGHADDVAVALAALGADDLGAEGPAAEPYLYRPQLAGREMALSAILESLGAAVASSGPPPVRVAVIDASPNAASVFGTVGTLDVSDAPSAPASRGSLVFIGGESGVGKTRLSIEVATTAVRRGFGVVTCQSIRVDTEGDVREGAVRAAPLHSFQSFLIAVADKCRARGQATFEELLGARGRILAPYERSFASLAGFDNFPPPPEVPPEAARSRVFTALAETMTAYSAHAPVLLVIDDLQWADELSLGFLRSLDARWFESNPVVVVGTYRVEEMSVELEALLSSTGVLNVVLERLDVESVVRVIRDMLAVEVPDPHLVSFLVSRSEGNPFFIAEYLRAAIGRGFLLRDDAGRWRYEAANACDIDALDLPPTLHELIALRLSGLSPAAARIARMIAVLGRELDGRVLDVALGRQGVLEDDAIRELLRRQVLEERGHGRIRFMHEKLREGIYAGISEPDRPAAHLTGGLALAAWGESTGETDRLAAELAHHFAEAHQTERACHYLERAGDQAIADGSYSDAVRYFDRAAGLVQEGADRSVAPARARARLGRWVRQTARAYHALGDLRSAEEKGRESLRILTGGSTLLDAGDPPAADLRARGAYFSGTARAVGTQLIGLFGGARRAHGSDDEELHREAALVCEKLGETYLFLNDQNRAALASVLAGNHAQRLGPSPELARACSQLAVVAAYLPAHALGALYANRAAKIARIVDDKHVDLDVELKRGFWSIGVADGNDARRSLTNAHRLACELSDRRREEESLALLGMLEAFHGRHAAALDHYEKLEELALRSQNEQARFWAQAGRAQVWSRSGRAEDEIVDDYDRIAPYINGAADTTERIQLVIPAPIYVKKGLRSRAIQSVDDFLRLTEGRSPTGCMLFWSYACACEAAFLLLDEASVGKRRAAEDRARRTVVVMEQFARIFPIGRSEAFRFRARVLGFRGALKPACKLLDRAIDEAIKFDLPVEKERAYEERERVKARSERPDQRRGW